MLSHSSRAEHLATSTANANSDFRRIRQSISLLETHHPSVQCSSDPSSSSTQAQPQRDLLSQLSVPLFSWPAPLHPAVGPTSWTSYLGIRSLPSEHGDMSPSGHESPKELWAIYEQDHDIVCLIPPLTVIDALIDYYFEHCTWLYHPVDAVAFLRRWSGHKSGIRPCRATLATACMLLATAVFHLPDGHCISPGQPLLRPEIGTRCYNVAVTLLDRCGPQPSPGRELDRVEFLLARAYYLTLSTVDSEELWLLRSQLIGAGTAFGLHRDPGSWGLPSTSAERRRMAWWNIVFLDRWHAFMFGRPYSISSRHFDTRLPVAYNTVDDKSSPIYTVHILLFRLAYLMGELMEDVDSLRPVAYSTILDHDHLLQEWFDALPPELAVNDATLAQSVAAPLAATRRAGIQGVALRLAFLHARFALHRAYAGGAGALCGDTPEMATSMTIAVDSASALLATGQQFYPMACGPHSASALTHLSSLPQHVCAAAAFLTLLIAEDPTRPDFQPLRTIVARSADKLSRFVGRQFANKAVNVLQALEPIFAEPSLQEDEKTQAMRTASAIARARAAAFPEQQPYAPIGPSLEMWHPGSPASPGELSPPLDSPQMLWGPSRTPLQSPPRKRARLQSSSASLMSSTSFSAPATPKSDLASFVMSRMQHQKHHSQELQGSAGSVYQGGIRGFEQVSASRFPAFKVPTTNLDSMWGSSIGFDKGELGQFFDDMDEAEHGAYIPQ
ncbi:hypothetical protein BC834DRAFT_636963 [Gloeopeniophorella convolvens]|nr:hypothetical protein BC834DRAFT_636963 [Gloeopeniophorella convolvens]